MVVALIAIGINLGLGRHQKSVSYKDIVTLIQIVLAIDVFYIWSLVWTKLSILLLYYRVFRFGYFKKAAYAIGGLVVVWAILGTFLTAFLCIPLEAVWNPTVPAHCMDSNAIRLFNAAFTILTDVLILGLPIPQIWTLQHLQTTHKLGLNIVFALGSLSVLLPYNAHLRGPK